MNPLQERRFYVGLIFLAAIAMLLGITRWAWSFDGIPFPRHIEWTQYNVDSPGWVLCRPSTPADSVSTPLVCLHLQPGTEVYVPRWVPGLSSEAERQQRFRSTAR